MNEELIAALAAQTAGTATPEQLALIAAQPTANPGFATTPVQTAPAFTPPVEKQLVRNVLNRVSWKITPPNAETGKVYQVANFTLGNHEVNCVMDGDTPPKNAVGFYVKNIKQATPFQGAQGTEVTPRIGLMNCTFAGWEMQKTLSEEERLELIAKLGINITMTMG